MLSLLLLLLPLPAHATTFGPLSVVEQARHSGYVVHGRVRGAAWVEMERQLNRPYTYWKLEVIEQPIGASLGGEVNMREPGGEIGDMGYQVAGSATFAAGEEVFVTLRDTNEPDTKEIVGLASGKYLVEAGADGKPVIRNGLGLPLMDPSGHPLSPREFTELLRRVAQNTDTDSDKKIFLNNSTPHEHEREAHEPEASLPAASANKNSAISAPASPLASTPDSAQKPAEKTEESSTGSSVELWVLLGAVLLGLLGLVALLRR